MKQKLLILAALFFGVLAFMFTFQQIKLERQKIEESAVDVAVIRVVRDITEGQKLQAEDVREFTIKRAAGAALTREIPWNQKDALLGRPVRNYIHENTILTWNDFDDAYSRGRTGLTKLVRPGYRAISIPVDSISSVTGLVQPNNYVDILGTFRFPDAKGDAALDTITLTILQQVKVVACGQDLGKVRGADNAPARSYSAVTLELTPKEAEMITFASQKGRLSLSLRNYEDSEITNELQSVDWSYLQKNIQQYNKEREARMKKLVR